MEAWVNCYIYSNSDFFSLTNKNDKKWCKMLLAGQVQILHSHVALCFFTLIKKFLCPRNHLFVRFILECFCNEFSLLGFYHHSVVPVVENPLLIKRHLSRGREGFLYQILIVFFPLECCSILLALSPAAPVLRVHQAGSPAVDIQTKHSFCLRSPSQSNLQPSVQA